MACGIVGTPAATVDHWAARARLQALTTRLAQVICPSGGLLTGVSSPLCKNISVSVPPKSLLELWPSHPTRGAYRDRHGRGAGCGGRGSVLRATGSQGGFLGTCERSTARGREMLLRTAKSYGPDAPTLASSFAEVKSARPGLDKTISADDGGKRARSPGRARRKPLKPLRAGMPGDSGVLVYSCAFYQCKARTRLRVQRAPGVPHALFGRKINANLGCFVLRDRETAFVVGAGTRNACPGCCAARRTCGVVRC